MAMLLPSCALLTALITASALGLADFLNPWPRQAQAAALGGVGAVAIGLMLALTVGVAYGVVVGAALGVTLTSAAGLILGLLAGSSPDRILGAILGALGGAAAGLALDAARAVALGSTRGLATICVSALAGGAVFGLVFSLVVLAVDPGEGVPAGAWAGASFSIALAAASLRLPLYPLEALFQIVLYRLQALGAHTLGLVPVLYHDLSRLPLPGLLSHILLGRESQPEEAEQVRRACERIPGQRQLSARLRPYLQARELEDLAERGDFGALLKLQGEWLPGVGGAEPWMLDLREAARYLQAALATPAAYHRKRHLDEAVRMLAALENQFAADSSALALAMKRAAQSWKSVAENLRREATSEAARQIPNPFRIEPLTPEQGELFRGREGLVQQIDALLANPEQSFSIALVGPRRCGKTSLLLMLPKLLPDAFCVFFDLQDNPLESPAAFFRSLAARAREQSLRDRRLEIPPLPSGPLLEAGRDWFNQLDHLGEQRRILLCLDEFERLETLFPGEPRELLQLMGLLRGTIQHRRHLRLLVAGAAPFDELGALWNDHFINLRELRVGHLEYATALDLLRRPIPEFPSAIPSEVAEAIFERTGGQPFLLQLYGSVLVNLLNEEARPEARLDDLCRADDQVLEAGTYYFRHTYQAAPPAARQALLALAAGETPSLLPHTRTWLRRRGLLADDTLRIPIFGTWLLQDEA